MKLRSFLLFASLLGSMGLALVAQESPHAGLLRAEPAKPPRLDVDPPKADVLGAMAWVPKGASAVILVNHPSQTLEAMDRLANRMKLKGASLMRQTLVDGFGGEPLMDYEASLVEFSYPLRGEKNEAESKTVQLRIMRVPSMKEFTSRFKAKAMSGGFFESHVKGKPTVAAFRGGYGILAPRANLAELKAALAEREVFGLPPQSHHGWLMEQDVALLLPVAVLADARAKPASRKDTLFSPFSPVDALMETVRSNPEGEVSHIAIGAKTEEGGGLAIEARLGFLSSGQAAQSLATLQGSLADVAGAATRGLPASAYAMALTAALPAGYASWLASTLDDQNGTASPEGKERKERLAAMTQTLQGLKSLGFVWSLGAEGAKPLQGSVLTMQVEDAAASLRAFESYAKLKPESGEAMTSQRGEYLGRTLLKLTVPPPKTEAPKEGEEPKKSMVDPAAFFGTEPLSTLVWAYDPHTLLVGFGEAATAFAQPIEALEHPEHGLGRLPAFALTQDMLGAEQQLQLFLSLQDILGAVGRILPIQIPLSDSAKTAPPLGFGFSLASTGMTVRAVAPGETVELVGTILESAMKMSQDAKKAAKGDLVAAETAPAEIGEPATKGAVRKAPAKVKKTTKKKH